MGRRGSAGSARPPRSSLCSLGPGPCQLPGLSSAQAPKQSSRQSRQPGLPSLQAQDSRHTHARTDGEGELGEQTSERSERPRHGR